MNTPLFRDESDICMMIGKRVNANASTLVRLNLRQGRKRVWGASPQPLARFASIPKPRFFLN